MTRTLLKLLLLVPLATGGCNALAYLLHLGAPGQGTVAVKPEFAGLPDSRVAIVIFAGEGVQYAHPQARPELSRLIADSLRKNVKNVTVVDPRQVMKYQDTNFHWDSLDRTKLGKQLNSDYVLFVSLIEFSTREQGMVNLLRGRILAEADLYKTSLPERDARVWREAELGVIFPADRPIGILGQNDSNVRLRTELLFAEKLVKKFYAHRAPKSK